MNGWKIVADYTGGFDATLTHWFNFEIEPVVEMFGRGDVTEERLRECCANLADGYRLGALLVDETDD